MSVSAVPFWLDEPYRARPALEGRVETEVCVIGGGVAGLSCARRLAGHGLDTVVLERGTVAGGASGRNGGFLLAGPAPSTRTRGRSTAPSGPAASTPAPSTPRNRCTRWRRSWAWATPCAASACCA